MSYKDKLRPAGSAAGGGYQSKLRPVRDPSGRSIGPEEPGWFEPGSISGLAATKAGDVLQGFAQGASLGFSDELTGALLAGTAGVVEPLAELTGSTPEEAAELTYRITGKTPGSDRSAYQVARDLQRGTQEEAFERTPVGYVGGGIAGAVAGGAGLKAAGTGLGAAATGAGLARLGAGLAKAGQIAGGAPQARPLQTIGGRLVELAKYGAPMGAATGLGASKADLTEGEVGGAVGDIATGTALGVAGAGLGTAVEVGPGRFVQLTGAQNLPLIGKLLPQRSFSEWLREKGLSEMLGSVLPQAGLTNRLRKLGVTTYDEQRALAEEIEKAGFVRPFETAGTALQRVEEAWDTGGERVGELLRQAQAKSQAGGPGVPMPSRDVQQAVSEAAMESGVRTPPAALAKQKAWERLSQLIGGDKIPQTQRIGDSRLGPATFPELWETKSQLQKMVNWQEMPELEQQLFRKGVQGYRKGVLQQVEGVLGPDVSEELAAEAAKMSTAAKVEELLRERVSREAAKKTFGITDLQKAQLAEQASSGMGGLMLAAGALTKGIAQPTLATGLLGAAKLTDPMVRYAAPAIVRTTSGPMSVELKKNAYEALRQRLGLDAQDDEDLANQAYIAGQTTPAAQPGRQ